MKKFICVFICMVFTLSLADITYAEPRTRRVRPSDTDASASDTSGTGSSATSSSSQSSGSSASSAQSSASSGSSSAPSQSSVSSTSSGSSQTASPEKPVEKKLTKAEIAKKKKEEAKKKAAEAKAKAKAEAAAASSSAVPVIGSISSGSSASSSGMGVDEEAQAKAEALKKAEAKMKASEGSSKAEEDARAYQEQQSKQRQQAEMEAKAKADEEAKLKAEATASQSTSAGGVATYATSKPGKGTFAPFWVYKDNGARGNHYYPTGWMGDYGDLKINPGNTAKVHSGTTAVKITYSAKMSQNAGWCGIYWQNPPNNWGDKKGGYNLTGAKRLSFWACGEKGGEVISEFKIGGISGEFPDSDTAMIGPIELSRKWQNYTIDLTGKDLTNIIGGFCFSASRDDNPEGFTIYVDDIVYE